MLALSRRVFPALTTTRSFSSTAFWSNAGTSVPSGLSEGEQHIYEKLTGKFAPSQLQVQDVSGVFGVHSASIDLMTPVL